MNIRKKKAKNNSSGPDQPRWLIAGLGNPGREYRRTRHNVGFWVIDRLASEYRIAVEESSHRAEWGVGSMAGISVLLARPQTFMNRSGESVAALVKAFDIGLTAVIIVHDDLDLPLGKLRWGFGSAAGGHHGVESIIGTLGSRVFNRLRVGIGRPPLGSPPDEITGYVLSPFDPTEREVIEGSLEEGSRLIVGWLQKQATENVHQGGLTK